MASTKITRTSATSTEKKLTISTWIKRSYIGEEALIGNTANGSNWAMFYFNGNNQLQFASYISGSYVVRVTTNRTFSDVGAWYHLVATLDVSLATPEAKIYVNGEEQTDLAYNVQPSQNADTGWFYDWNFEIGVMFTSSYYLNGYLSDLYYIQGYIYPASTFGETDSVSGIWKPITSPTINYGGNGGNSCHLKFENSGNMDLDSGSNNISFTTTGTITQTEDTPSNNFCTNNVLSPVASGLTIANGNLSITSNSGNGWRDLFGTLGVASGKWYWEQKIDNFSSGLNPHYIGVCDVELVKQASNATAFEDSGVARAYAYTKTGQKLSAGTYSSYGDSWTTGDIVGIAVDLDNGKIYFSKNGTFQNSGDPTSGATGTGSAFDVTTGYTYVPLTATYYADNRYSYNFGNGYFGTTAVASSNSDSAGLGLFEFSVPANYYSLCTKNIKNYG